MQISPPGILYKLMDSKQLMMVPHELHQKILVENHDVPIVAHVGINKTVDLSNGITGGMVYGVM